MKIRHWGLLAIGLAGLASCTKEISAGSGANTGTTVQQAAQQQQAIAIAASTTTAGDSIYVMHTCEEHEKLTLSDSASLPSAALSYLDSTYAGYSGLRVFSVSDSSGQVKGYIAVFQYNGNPVALKFDASGNFVRVLEQMEGQDLENHERGGDDWHQGGCFDYRDGHHRDTLAIDSLPPVIVNYMSTNYPSDTLLRAMKKRNGDYVVISRDSLLYANVFDSTGSFVSRVVLPAGPGAINVIDAGALPAAVTNYLNSTYPGYVIDKAYSFSENGTVKGYGVLINSNNTRYALLFSSSGAFIAVKVIP